MFNEILENIKTFMEANWFPIELILAAILIVAIITLIVCMIINKKYVRMIRLKNIELKNKCDETSDKLLKTELARDELLTKNTTAKNEINSLKAVLDNTNLKSKTLQDTVNKQMQVITNLTSDLNASERDKAAALREAATIKEELNERLTNADKAIEKLTSENEKLNKENKDLKLLEVENKVLLQAISDGEKAPVASSKEKKKEAVSGIPSPTILLLEGGPILSADITPNMIGDMERKDLFKVAKFFGLKNYAILPTETIRNELIKIISKQ